ncbi:MAG TPA: ABC transporter substrate-binding protein [Candidatus Competibacter denitrificans]|nr:ABC transporter substrate-binding protein [Candidatus Competibacter denitrificans]HRC68240.1 ABC transporter substrate-binding protein [Candidatus Competibacter denitrificans]
MMLFINNKELDMYSLLKNSSFNRSKKANRRIPYLIGKLGLGLLLGVFLTPLWGQAEEAGVTDKTIRIGSTLPLEGDFKVYGLAQKRGMEAALAGQTVQKRTIEYLTANDFYTPDKTMVAAKDLIAKGIFAMVNSYGSPTTKAALPILAENKVPAFGFLTGVGFTGPGDVLNFRVSYTAETDALVEIALAAGVKPVEVCMYIQNDVLGLAGVKGMRAALARHSGTEAIVQKLDQILNMPGDSPDRNNIGPVGAYLHHTISAHGGYQSLKKWEADNNSHCRFVVVLTAIEEPANMFMAFARYKGEPWFFSASSLLVGERLAKILSDNNVKDKVISAQVVPSLDSALPVVADARKALGKTLDYYSLEAYLVGRSFVTIMQAIEGPITREAFLKAARRQPYDVGGVKIDFTTDNQGSDFLETMVLQNGHFIPISRQDIAPLLK